MVSRGRLCAIQKFIVDKCNISLVNVDLTETNIFIHIIQLDIPTINQIFQYLQMILIKSTLVI